MNRTINSSFLGGFELSDCVLCKTSPVNDLILPYCLEIYLVSVVVVVKMMIILNYILD